MSRMVETFGLLLADLVIAAPVRADDRAEVYALLRRALAAMAEAEGATSPAARLQVLEQAAADLARLVRGYANTFIGL